MGDMRYSAVFLHMHIETVRVEVPGHHLARVEDAVLLRERLLRKELQRPVSAVRKSHFQPLGQLTVSLESSPSCIFLPTSLLVHSSVLSPDWLVIPGTTRGIVGESSFVSSGVTVGLLFLVQMLLNY